MKRIDLNNKIGSKVFDDGMILEDWSIDYNPRTKTPDTNGGVELLIRYAGSYYIVTTDWDYEKSYSCYMVNVDEARKERSHIWNTIKLDMYRRKREGKQEVIQ